MTHEFEIDQKMTGTQYMLALKRHSGRIQSFIQEQEMSKRWQNHDSE